jgi:hypothetical protein
MWHPVDWYWFADVSEESTACLFKAEDEAE